MFLFYLLGCFRHLFPAFAREINVRGDHGKTMYPDYLAHMEPGLLFLTVSLNHAQQASRPFTEVESYSQNKFRLISGQLEAGRIDLCPDKDFSPILHDLLAFLLCSLFRSSCSAEKMFQPNPSAREVRQKLLSKANSGDHIGVSDKSAFAL